jgi:hypothetical protein
MTVYWIPSYKKNQASVISIRYYSKGVYKTCIIYLQISTGVLRYSPSGGISRLEVLNEANECSRKPFKVPLVF